MNHIQDTVNNFNYTYHFLIMMSTTIRIIVMIMNNKAPADGTTLAMISVVDIPGNYISELHIP